MPHGTGGFLLPDTGCTDQPQPKDRDDSPVHTRCTESLTGAQALVRSLEEVGADVVFGIPGGAILPAYDPLFDSTRVRHVLVRHEQGAGHAAEGYAQASGKVGVCMATSGPGATNLVTPDRRRLHGLGADGRDHRPGRPADDRDGRVPGSRHLRHHAADHQAQLPRAGPGEHRRRRSPRRSTSPRPAGPGPVLVDLPKDVLQERTTFSWPPRLDLPGYKPVDPSARQADPRGGAADRRGAPAGALRRRRRHQGPRDRRAARARRAHRHPGRHDADGARRVPRQPPPAPRHARHARHGRRGDRAAEGRPADHARRSLRRPGDRSARQLRAAGQDHPRRHRPGRDRQEPRGGRPDRGRRARGAARARAGGAGRVRRRATAPT